MSVASQPHAGSSAVRWPRTAAIALAVLAGVALVAGLALQVARETGEGAAVFAALALVGALTVVLGLLVAHREPGNVVAPLLVAEGCGVVANNARDVAWAFMADEGFAGPVRDWIVALTREAGIWLLVTVALLLLYFPDGRLPSRRWRWVPPGLLAAGAVNHLWGIAEPSPPPAPLDDVPPVVGDPPGLVVAASLIAFAGMLILVVACAASLVVRYRRSGSVRRAQIKWLALAGLAYVLTPVVAMSELAVLGEVALVTPAVALMALVALPLAVAIAILRHDLYDVDKAIVTTGVYGAGTVLLVLTYVAASFVSGLVLGGGSSAAAAAAAAVAAVALSPLRGRLQARLDRRLYPLRRTALGAIEDLVARTHAGQAQPEQLEDVLRDALRDPGLRVGFLLPGAGQIVDRRGAQVDTTGSVAVTLGGAPIGVLLPVSASASRELLADVAKAAAGLVEVIRLRLELAAALREVAESRKRLLHAADVERRRLERDLHDGAQQRLVALGMSLRLAQRRLRKGPVDVDALIDDGVEQLTSAVRELRQIAHGLRPSSLDEGLRPALSALLHAVPMTADLDVRVDEVPESVATTVYYVASEAVANALKHAHAERIAVEVSPCDGHVRVRVRDDGRGGASLSGGSGLAGLSDRMAAVNGRLSVQSPSGGGTVVEALVPCAS